MLEDIVSSITNKLPYKLKNGDLRFFRISPIKGQKTAATRIENLFKIRSLKLFNVPPANLRNIKKGSFDV